MKGLCQKYTATLTCHSTFANLIHGCVADIVYVKKKFVKVISNTVMLICMSFISRFSQNDIIWYFVAIFFTFTKMF